MSIALEDIPKILPLLPESERTVLLAELAKLEELKGREAAQLHFIDFVQKVWPQFIAGRHHYKMAEAFERVAQGKTKRLIINMGPRHCLALDTPLLTTGGWRTMAEIQPGDHVFGPDGLPTKVLGKSEVHTGRTLYRVTTNDGASLVTDGGHLWTVRLDRKRPTWQSYTTEQLWLRQNGYLLRAKRNGEVELRPSWRTAAKRFPRLPDIAAIDMPPASLPVDPYVMGLWLGDGTRHCGIITAHEDDAAFYRPEIERRGYATTDQTTPSTFGILGLKVLLREAGVLNNKHIPESYLTSSIDQRMDLLRGLMDSDGNVSKQGQCFFSQKSLAFITQVRELLWSLGIYNTLQVSEAKIGSKSYGDTYKVSFYKKDCALLPRKRCRTKDPVAGRFISVERLENSGSVQCIEVARTDGLFLAGKGMVCTHNTKSEFASYLLPAWYLGKFPDRKIIQCSHTAELAVGFGRKVRNLFDDADFVETFPDVALASDSKAAGRWNTNKKGIYFAIGVGGAVTGMGADLLIIDDPHSEQEAALAEVNPDIYDKTYEWYTSGPRQRLQPGGAIVIVMTRWAKRDLTGRILQDAAANGSLGEWEVIEFPAILPSGNPLWPEFWSLEELERVKRDIPNSKWQAQYQQNPVSESAAIIKREWWQLWDSKTPPQCDFILQSWDTAFEKTQRADYSACTTWGVFYDDKNETGVAQANIILLNAIRDRVEFPELKKMALEEYRAWEPDSVIIEKKASGAPLIYELRAMGIPVQEFTPTRGNDKISRLNAVADIFASGRVWAPAARWAEEVIDETAEFPAGSHDDFTDTVSMALHRFRKGGFVSTSLDEPDEIQYFKSNRNRGYY